MYPRNASVLQTATFAPVQLVGEAHLVQDILVEVADYGSLKMWLAASAQRPHETGEVTGGPKTAKIIDQHA